MTRDDDRDGSLRSDGDFGEAGPRKRVHPLLWLLVLLALFALGWAFYNHHAGSTVPAPTAVTQPPQPAPTR